MVSSKRGTTLGTCKTIVTYIELSPEDQSEAVPTIELLNRFGHRTAVPAVFTTNDGRLGGPPSASAQVCPRSGRAFLVASLTY